MSELNPHRGMFYLGMDTELYLFHVQRTDGSAVTDARFTNHRLGKLNLSCDIGHLHWVVVVVCDIQGILKENKELEEIISIDCTLYVCVFMVKA